MITIEGVSKQFKGKIALDQVSFTAEDGKVTGFLGPNGAGKSTTMRAALGLIKPDAGRALIDGKPFRESASPYGPGGRGAGCQIGA
jgi:ABC-2 type transport system ATP-binding protein